MQKINVVLLLLLQHITMILHSTASCCCCNCSFNIHDHCICTSRTIHNQSFFQTQTIIPSFHSLEFLLQAQNPCCQIRFVVAGRNLATAPPLQMSFHLPPSLPGSLLRLLVVLSSDDKNSCCCSRGSLALCDHLKLVYLLHRLNKLSYTQKPTISICFILHYRLNHLLLF